MALAQLQSGRHGTAAIAGASAARSLRPLASGWPSCTRRRRAGVCAAAEPFYDVGPLGPSLSSIADMRRQVDQDMDDLLGFGFGRRLQDSLDRQFADMDRQMDAAFSDLDRLQRGLDAELGRSLAQLEQQQPGVSIQRREERAPGAYRYYESIQIRSGGFAPLTPATHHAPGGLLFSPLLFLALALAGGWASLTAAFARNYELTTYRRDRAARWRLLLAWPLLLPFSGSFRQQFASALRGEQVRVLHDGDAEPGARRPQQEKQQQQLGGKP